MESYPEEILHFDDDAAAFEQKAVMTAEAE